MRKIKTVLSEAHEILIPLVAIMGLIIRVVIMLHQLLMAFI